MRKIHTTLFSNEKKKEKTHNLVVRIDECIFSSDIEFTHFNVQFNFYSFFFGISGALSLIAMTGTATGGM